ncbi:hypothetical protein BH23PLA1_BH23PLA1_21990 [soil metagenome]
MVGASDVSWMRRLATLALVLACLAVPLLVIFSRVLFQDHQVAFRDAGHFYYPLVERVQQEWDAGRIPLWAPEASAGMPLLGNPTAAVFYPGKLVFFWLPYPWAMRVFLVGHVALAFLTMGALLRGWRISTTGSVLGALSYVFGVPVLSQTNNMIFLVGAAWAPLGFLAADRWVRGRSPWALAGLVVVLALQVLGGDPEAAYMTFVCAAGYALGTAAARPPSVVGRWLRVGGAALIVVILGSLGLSWWSAHVMHLHFSEASRDSLPWSPPKTALVSGAWCVVAALVVWRVRRQGNDRGLLVTLGGLFVAAAIALAITGAQLLPVLEYSRKTFRAAESGGYNDYYGYSLHPLQMVEVIWPGALGTLEGGYRTWLNALPPKPQSRLWMPSVFMGGLTLILAMTSLSFRSGPPWRVWMSVLEILSLLASFGYFGSPLSSRNPSVPSWHRRACGPHRLGISKASTFPFER